MQRSKNTWHLLRWTVGGIYACLLNVSVAPDCGSQRAEGEGRGRDPEADIQPRPHAAIRYCGSRGSGAGRARRSRIPGYILMLARQTRFTLALANPRSQSIRPTHNYNLETDRNVWMKPYIDRAHIRLRIILSHLSHFRSVLILNVLLFVFCIDTYTIKTFDNHRTKCPVT